MDNMSLLETCIFFIKITVFDLKISSFMFVTSKFQMKFLKTFLSFFDGGNIR